MEEMVGAEREAFIKDLDALCDRHGCRIKLVLRYSEDGVKPGWRLVRLPKEEVKPEESVTPAQAQDAPVGEVAKDLPEQPQV